MPHVDEVARHKLPHSTRILLQRELRRLERLLGSREELLNLAHGHHEGGSGLVALTDRRVLFVGRVLMIEERTFKAQLREFRCEELRSVRAESRPLSGKLTLSLRHGKAVVTEVTPRERCDEIGAQLRTRLAPQRRRAARTAVRPVPSSLAA